ncbi:MAG: hypothetical protein QOI53_3372 [Verrucomicrobiota bacterium]|nr:hypothetical protein [Verrucomicrobiota bacterium]
MVWAVALRLPLSEPLAQPLARRTGIFGRCKMGILDCGRGLSPYLAGGTAES